ITGRSSPLTARRARDLGIAHLQQGREDKLVALRELLETLNLTLEDTAYVGDDLPDLSAICHAGLGITVPNGHPLVLRHARWCTTKAGGDGAVRQVCDLILHAQGLLESTYQRFL
ncbi:MAG: HAD hydrolase family protein, partial [Gammaproteobacteria bacterium]|nr:HAD hydrolase family protein [Gammaproteobacteria bacterium]